MFSLPPKTCLCETRPLRLGSLNDERGAQGGGRVASVATSVSIGDATGGDSAGGVALTSGTESDDLGISGERSRQAMCCSCSSISSTTSARRRPTLGIPGLLCSFDRDGDGTGEQRGASDASIDGDTGDMWDEEREGGPESPPPTGEAGLALVEGSGDGDACGGVVASSEVGTLAGGVRVPSVAGLLTRLPALSGPLMPVVSRIACVGERSSFEQSVAAAVAACRAVGAQLDACCCERPRAMRRPKMP